MDRPELVRVLGESPELQVLDLGEEPVADPAQVEHAGVSDLPPVEADRVRAQAGHQPLDVQVAPDPPVVAGGRDLEPDLAVLAVDPDVEEPLAVLEAFGVLRHRRQRTFVIGRPALGRGRSRGRQGQPEEEADGREGGEPRAAAETEETICHVRAPNAVGGGVYHRALIPSAGTEPPESPSPMPLPTRPKTALRALLLLVACLAGPAGWPAPAAAQDPAAQATAAAGNRVPAAHRTPRATMMSFLRAFYGERRIEQAVAALDLSAVPESLRSLEGPELAVQLKDVLDRTARIDPEDLPDVPDAAPYRVLERPEGAVVLDRGPNGEWRFTAATVAAVPELYRALQGQAVVAGVEEAPVDLSPGLWLRSKMPAGLRATRFILEPWQWLGLLVLALVGIVLDRLVVALAQVLTGRWLRRHVDRIDSETLRRALRPLGILAMAVAWTSGIRFLWLPVDVLAVLAVAVRFVVAAGAVWAAYRLVDIVSALLEARAARTRNRFDDLLVPLVRKSLKVFITAFGLVFIADTLDIQIKSLLAGLGLGGLAVALAAQDAVKNLFGSLMVLVDRPFSVGDWIVVGDFEGTVEEVGFRSIRIRTFYNSLITLPNSNLIASAVDNYGARRFRRWSTRLSIAYDTPPERIDAFCEGIRELVRRHPATRKDSFHVYLNAFGDSALEVLLYLFFEVGDWSEELAARHGLALDVLRLADELGVELAFPTRTVWLHQARTPGDGSAGIADEEAAGDGRRAAARAFESDPVSQ